MRVIPPEELEEHFDTITNVGVDPNEWVALHLPDGALIMVASGRGGDGFHVMVYEEKDSNPVLSYHGEAA